MSLLVATQHALALRYTDKGEDWGHIRRLSAVHVATRLRLTRRYSRWKIGYVVESQSIYKIRCLSLNMYLGTMPWSTV